MNSLMILWYANLLFAAFGVIVTGRAIYDAVSENTPEIKKALAPSFAIWSALATCFAVMILCMPFSLLGTEFIQPKFGWVGLTILAAIFAAWKLGCLTPEKTEEDAKEPTGVVEVLKSMLPMSVQKVIETVYGLDPKKPVLTEKSLSVASERTAADKKGTLWDDVYSWRARDFKGSLVKWLRENGPKSRLIPATFELYQAMTKGVYCPWWNKNEEFTAEGLSLRILDKKYFFRWEDLVFQVKYDLYDYHTVGVTESKLHFTPTTIYLFAMDGTEIGWVRDEDSALFGNLEVGLEMPKKVVSRKEGYVFEYQDGVSGCYGEDIPVYYFASDLAKKVKEEKKAEKA